MNDKLSKILSHRLTVPVSVGVVSFISGAAAGYFLARRQTEVYAGPSQLELDFADGSTDIQEVFKDIKKNKVLEIEIEDDDEEVQEMLEEMAEQPITLVIDEEDLEQILPEKAEQILATKIKEAIVSNHEDDEPVRTQVQFAGNNEEWDYDVELEHRSPEMPYILHKDEFYNDEMNFTQTTLTFYASDNIMSDEEDQPIYNWEHVTGPLTFGHGSSDPNVFYVRNEKRRAEYEVLFHTGSYSSEVLGLEADEEEERRGADMKHSKFRMD